ncbi:MAG TPA: hypothetical protein VIM70_15730 [Clostridium sp.]|uniref:hypothetical protein n=1 Tax=Clostridium sp. TaxID=1506 RepID=UPI002F931BD0
MYDYRCKNCENLGQCMPMMNMPMYEENDEDLKNMYPKIYIRIYPMVKHHCDMMMSCYGPMYCPSNDEMEHMCKEVCDRYEKYYRDDEDDEDHEHHEHREDPNDDDMRQRQRFNRRGIGDLARILFIGDLLGRRRRRRFFDHNFDHDFDHGHHHGY